MPDQALIPQTSAGPHTPPAVPPVASPVQSAETDPTARPPKQRDAFFDNAKFLAIVLVACAHSWEPLFPPSRAAEALYITVYAFHMPVFIVISGYFSRSFQLRPAQLRRLVTGIVLPYVVFEVAYTLFNRWVGGHSGQSISLLDPWYLTWFLGGLFIWRLTTPLWKAVRWPLAVSLVVAVLAATSSSIGGDLDLHRVLQFLPFFVLGLFLKPEHFELVRRRALRIAAVPVLAAALAAAYWLAPGFKESLFFRRESVQELGYSTTQAVWMTLALYACSLLLSVCFLALVPRRRTWFTSLGAATLYGYLLHGFVVRGADYWGWYDHAWVHSPLGEVAVTAVAAVLVTVLCTAPVRRVFRCVMEPEMRWAFKRDS